MHTPLAFLIAQLSRIAEPLLSSGAGTLDAAPQLIDIEPELIESLRRRRVWHTDQGKQQIAEVRCPAEVGTDLLTERLEQ